MVESTFPRRAQTGVTAAVRRFSVPSGQKVHATAQGSTLLPLRPLIRLAHAPHRACVQVRCCARGGRRTSCLKAHTDPERAGSESIRVSSGAHSQRMCHLVQVGPRYDRPHTHDVREFSLPTPLLPLSFTNFPLKTFLSPQPANGSVPASWAHGEVSQAVWGSVTGRLGAPWTHFGPSLRA